MDYLRYFGLLVLLLPKFHANGEIFTHLSECCNAGANWGTEKSHCQNYDYAIDQIPPVWRGLCLQTFAMCCSKELEKQHCLAGRIAAKNSSNCDGSQYYNSSFYTNCCKACQIGLAVAASGNNCTSSYLSYFSRDESYAICCNDMTNDDTFILAEDGDICGKVDKLCDHICENTKDSYVCKCRPGYKLDANHVTCSPITDIGPNDSEEIDADDDLSKCARGFIRNEDTLECDDIDECASGFFKCNPGQQCHNTIGSYVCVYMGKKSCQEGYKFNSKTFKCEDINECLEDIDDCGEDDYICINTEGSYKCQDKSKCEAGYWFNDDINDCEDINECHDKPCDIGFACINYPGNYECRRPVTSARGKISAPIPVEPCDHGYRFKHNKCLDIDECLTDKSACDSSQNCINEQGTYHCECKIGFRMDSSFNACVDINECQINNHNCLPSQRCDNTIGSFTCIRLQSCGTGYTLNAETSHCDDDNECELGTHDCPDGYDCRNTMGSFRCDRKHASARRLTTKATSTRATTTSTTTTPATTTTTTGRTTTTTTTAATTTTSTTLPPATTQSKNSYYYRRNDSYASYRTRDRQEYTPTSSSNTYRSDLACGIGFEKNRLGACVDIDECRANPCGSHQRCINTNGSYRCQSLLVCSGGYKSNPEGTGCFDINECETGEHNCGPDQTCTNRMGGYICSCPPGHMPGNGNRCVDINECEYSRSQACPINSKCINTIGSYFCECKPGFRKQVGEDKICVDVDECQEIRGACEQNCDNHWGSYKCSCNLGYQINTDNRTCTDVNECEIHKSYNLCMGFCNNSPGSYQCSCPAGYELGADKRACRDIDECALPSVCSGRNEICTNIRGSYRCNVITCPFGYTMDPDQKNRCKLVDFRCDGEDCFQKPSAYTYNFITMISKTLIPPQGRALFTIGGPDWYENIDFDLKIARIEAPPNVEKATEQHFSTNRTRNHVQLSLMRSLEGPQDIDLELSMTFFMNGQPRGKTVAKILIIVSEYSF